MPPYYTGVTDIIRENVGKIFRNYFVLIPFPELFRLVAKNAITPVELDFSDV